MVYEGRRGSGRKKGKSVAGSVFKALLWCLILVVAAAVLFPKQAAKVRDRIGSAIGVDIGGAMEVFSREVKTKNIFSATKSAFRYAFSPEPGNSVEVLAGDTRPDGKGETDKTDPETFKDLPLPVNVTAEMPRKDLVLAGPLAGSVVRGFGYGAGEDGEPVFHYGVDVKSENGSSVRCVADGTVSAVGESAIFGKYVIVTHADRVESLYAMLGDTALTEGASVKAGEVVGTLAGDTLHMELLIDGDYVDPQYYVYRDEAQS